MLVSVLTASAKGRHSMKRKSRNNKKHYTLQQKIDALNPIDQLDENVAAAGKNLRISPASSTAGAKTKPSCARSTPSDSTANAAASLPISS